jgi:hypothetical protein
MLLRTHGAGVEACAQAKFTSSKIRGALNK